MDGFESREEREEAARRREEANAAHQQKYRVVEDRGWAPEVGAYGARVIVVAPSGGAGWPPEVDDVLSLTGKKHNQKEKQ